MTGQKLRHVPQCSRCRLDNGWIYEDDGSFHRCDHGATSAMVAMADKDETHAAIALANPNALEAALRIIGDTAHRLETFSSNDCRTEMTHARIPGPVIGTAFGQAARNGWIRRDGYVPSTDPGTKSHPVALWRSMIFRAGRTA